MLHSLSLPALRQTYDHNEVYYDTDLPIPRPFAPEESFRDSRKMQEHVTPLKPIGSAGIFTCYPSVTPFGLALGPANPGTILVALETLGLRWTGFLPVFLLLMPTFSLRNAPRWLTPFASAQLRMLPYHCTCLAIARHFGN